MNTVVVAVALVAGAGCHTKERERVDAPEPPEDATDIDGAPDAAIDTPPVMIDPDCAGTSPSCTTAPTTFISITAPTQYAYMVRVQDTLYVSTYDVVNSQVTAGRVIAADLVSGTQTTLIPSAISYGLSAARGWAYAIESDVASGSIWRFRPGVEPKQLVTGRPYLRAVTADDTHVYWAEQGTSTTVVMRRAIAGGAIEHVMDCPSAYVLLVDDNDAYCAQFDHDILRAPKAGTDPAAGIAYSTYPYSAMIRCGADLFATNMGEPTLFIVPTPFGPISPFATVPGIGRFLGVTATAEDFYVSAYGMVEGIYRVNRSTANFDPIVPGDFAELSPVAWNGQLLYLARDYGVRRCID